jgi:uncharacterized membrane protein
MSVIGIHIVAGALALILGAVTLLARTRARLHRRSGQLFVTAMLVMGITVSVLGNMGGGLMSATSSSPR